MISNSLKRRRIERLSKNEISQKSCKSWLIYSTNSSAMLCFEIYKAHSIGGSGAPPLFFSQQIFFLKLPILNRFIMELYPPPTHTIWGITNMGGGWCGITHLTNASSPLPALPRIRICRKSENAYSCYISVIKKTLS